MVFIYIIMYGQYIYCIVSTFDVNNLIVNFTVVCRQVLASFLHYLKGLDKKKWMFHVSDVISSPNKIVILSEEISVLSYLSHRYIYFAIIMAQLYFATKLERCITIDCVKRIQELINFKTF